MHFKLYVICDVNNCLYLGTSVLHRLKNDTRLSENVCLNIIVDHVNNLQKLDYFSNIRYRYEKYKILFT